QLADTLIHQREEKLYEVSRLSVEDAKKIILSELSDKLVAERAALVKESNEQAQAKAEHYATKLIVEAIQ
ncbi:MAG: Rnase Y domain-containing protein, partial [Lactobacillus iners]|nr:Rnase Y domain-containing protein [Lactobacillus iners]